jgi:hypothetical protein
MWRRILKKGTHINCGTSPGKSSCLYNLVSGDDLLRGGAASYWACGTDGLYLFNECYREPHRLDTLESYLNDICSAEKLTTVKRRYAVDSICTMPGYSARRMFPCPLGIRFEGYVIDRMSRNITLRLTTGPVNKDSTCTLSIAFDDKTDEKSLKEIGITVLHNEKAILEKNGAEITLIGIDDPRLQGKTKDKEYACQVIKDELSIFNNEENYKIVLSHRPEVFKEYVNANIDLALTGHAHGGQAILPFIGGIIAPNQGFFPKYYKGIYQENNTKMIVSRGIGNSLCPIRFNNKPELIVVELEA